MTIPSPDVTAATSPALGPDPDRGSSVPDAEPAADVAASADEAPVVDERSVATYQDEDGRVHYASPHSKATKAKLASGQWTEVDVDEPPFDPTTVKRVRDVVAYLEAHAGDQAEIDRVKKAEAAGDDRPTIASWEPSR